MEIRKAKVSDGKAVYALVTEYAEQDKMLFRSLADIYESLQTFQVAELDGRILGCCALEVVWSDLAEIKSLAVEHSEKDRGIGTLLVGAAVEEASRLGVSRVFALTLEPAFFVKHGFEIVEKHTLPMKVWSDCAKCPKQDNCDETAVVKNLSVRG